MRAAIVPMNLLLTLCVLSGCGQSGRSKRTHETVVKDSITSMRVVSESMNSVRDAASAQKAEATIRREAEHLQKLKDELAALGQPSSKAKDRAKQHTQKVIDGSQKIKQATASMVGIIRSGQLPRDIGVSLANAADQYGKAMVDFGNQAKILD